MNPSQDSDDDSDDDPNEVAQKLAELRWSKMIPAKFPRIPHLPWSPGGTNDDKRLAVVDHFLNVPLTILEKLDGSNLCMTRAHLFARSHGAPPQHPSFDLAKALHASIAWRIPLYISIYGEWLYAKHSIQYRNLPAYFAMFAAYDEQQHEWLSWKDTERQATEIGVYTVPVLANIQVARVHEIKAATDLHTNISTNQFGEREGIVVRTTDAFSELEFSGQVAKWVRKGHVQTSDHWTTQKIVRNKLRQNTKG